MPKTAASNEVADSLAEDNQSAEGGTISSDDESKSSASNSNMADEDSSPSSPNGNGPRKISLVATLAAIVGAIAVGLLAGKHYGAVLNVQSATTNSNIIEAEAETAAPQCEEEDQNNSQKLSFQFAKLEDEKEDEDDDKDYDKEDDEEDDEDDDEEIDSVANLRQLMINAYGLEDHFEEYDIDSHNGKEIISEFLEDMVEASDACEDVFQLYGHYAYDANELGGKSNTLHAMALFRHGMGHVSLTAWPSEGKVIADFLILPERSSSKKDDDKDDHEDDDDDDDDDDENDDDDEEIQESLFVCIDSIAKFFYPDDVVEPNGIKGHLRNVPHLSQMGPFEVLSTTGKDPFRYRWWTDKTRGFSGNSDLQEADFMDQMGCSDDWTNRVVSVQSPFQKIDIVDSEDDYATLPLLEYYTNPGPEFAEGKTYMEAHPAFFVPDRMLYLDGVIQSTMQGLAAYHEALVHPAMFTHPHPKRVAIVGGGECATLRETLKHNTVDKVVMVEIDPVIVEVSKHYLPEWNDCSMFEDSARYCMDDPRVDMYHLDALKWFRDRFSDEARLEGHELYGTEEKFDVVILDALDPQNAVDFVEALYGDGAFLNSLFNSLTDDGVLLTQVGEAVYIGDVAETYPGNYNYQRSMYEKGLKNQGFTVVMNYEEPRAGFDGIWSFFAAFKDDSSRARWNMNEAQLDLEIQKRAVRRVDEDEIADGEIKGLFDYFDGPTMLTYRNPSKHAQVVYCMRDPKPYGCTTDINDHYAQKLVTYEPTGFDPEIPNLSAENFSVTNSSSLVSRVTVPENSYMMLEQTIHDVQIPPSTSAILRSEVGGIYDRTIGPVTNFVSGDREGLTIPRRRDINSAYKVDSGLLSFLGHGCDGTSNTESVYHSPSSPSSLTEGTADPDNVPEDGLLGRSYNTETVVVKDLVFNPSYTRNANRPEFLISARTIPEGEGITSNYVPWYNEAGWKDHIESLRSRCSGNQ